MIHHLDDIVNDVRVVVVHRDQITVAFEGFEVSRTATEPFLGFGVVMLERLPIARKIGTDVVEHPVEEHPQATAVGFVDQPVEIAVVTQTGIDLKVVGGVVAVGARGEYRPECDPGDAESDGVIEPVDDPA